MNVTSLSQINSRDTKAMIWDVQNPLAIVSLSATAGPGRGASDSVGAVVTEVKETDAGTFEAIDRTISLDVFIKLSDNDPSHGLVFTVDEPLQLKTARNPCGTLKYWASLDMRIMKPLGEIDPFEMYKDDMVSIENLTEADGPIHFARLRIYQVTDPRAVTCARGTSNECVKCVTEFVVCKEPRTVVVQWDDFARPCSGSHLSAMFLKAATHYSNTYEVATARASTVIPEEASMPTFDSQTGDALNCEAFYVCSNAPGVIVTQTELQIQLPTTAITLERTARDAFAAAKPNVSPVPVRAYVHATCASFNSHHAHVVKVFV